MEINKFIYLINCSFRRHLVKHINNMKIKYDNFLPSHKLLYLIKLSK